MINITEGATSLHQGHVMNTPYTGILSTRINIQNLPNDPDRILFLFKNPLGSLRPNNIGIYSLTVGLTMPTSTISILTKVNNKFRIFEDFLITRVDLLLVRFQVMNYNVNIVTINRLSFSTTNVVDLWIVDYQTLIVLVNSTEISLVNMLNYTSLETVSSIALDAQFGILNSTAIKRQSIYGRDSLIIVEY